MQRVKAPDGTIIAFPDSMGDEAISAVMRKQYGGPKTEDVPPPLPETKTKSQRGSILDPFIGQGVLMGAGDEIKSAVRAGVKAPFSDKDFGEIYNQELANTRADLAGFRERNPVIAPVAEVGGAVTGVLGTGGASLIPRAATTAGRVAAGAGLGAAESAVHGFNAGEGGLEPRLTNAAISAAVGAPLGAAGGAVAGRMASKAVDRAVPSVDALKNTSHRLYDVADKAGVVIKDSAYRRVVNNVALKARSAGMDHGVHPKAGAAITRLLDEVGQPQTLREMETLRRVLGSAARSTEPDERRVASIMIDALDEEMDQLGPKDISAGNIKVGMQSLTGARELWKRGAKGEIVENMMEDAGVRSGQFSQSGMENALRTEFRKLSLNRNRMRQFTKEEQAAIRRVAGGGVVENGLRMLGKFAPRGIVSAGLSSGIGYTLGGPAGSLAVMGAGEVGRRAATNMTISNAERVGQMARAGGALPKVSLTEAQRKRVIALVTSGVPLGEAVQQATEAK